MRTRTFATMATLPLTTFLWGCTTEITNLIPPTEPPIVNVVPVDCNANPDHEDCQTEPEDDPINLNGLWFGALTDEGAAFATASWSGSVTHAAASWSGSWTTPTGLVGTFAGAMDDAGRISGTLSYTDGAGTCSGRLDGTASTNSMTFAVGGMLGSCAPVPTVLRVRAAK